MRINRKLAGLLGLAALLGGARAGLACSCLLPPPPLEALEQSTAVFAGRVLEIRAADEMRLEVLFEVERAWKGVSGRRVLAWTPSNEAACGMNFMWGERYLVYASDSGDSGGLSVYLCSRTAPLGSAGADLEALGSGTEPPVAAGLEGDLTGDGRVDLSDAVRSLRIVVGVEPPAPANEVSGDGRQTLADTMMLLRHAVGLPSRFPVSRVDPSCGDWRASQTVDASDSSSPVRRLVLEGRCTVPSEGYRVELSPSAEQGLNTWILSIDKTVHPPAGSTDLKEMEVPVRFEVESAHEYILLTLLPDRLAVLVPPAF